MGDAYLGRQPILDRSQQIVAYELLFRGGPENVAKVGGAIQATADVIATAFSELAIGDALGPCLGFINVDADFLLSDTIEILPPRSVVLEILETVSPTPEVVARAAALRERGFALALDDVIQVRDDYAPLIELADIIKVDLPPLDDFALKQLAARLKPFGKRLLAEKVETRERMETCLGLGFALFQGYYFARPTVISGKRLSPARLVVMQLLSLILDDAETGDLEQAFKHEPGLTMNLLRITNSVASGLTVRITSLRHAITILGRRQLQRWLQLLLFADPTGSHGVTPLLTLAATRGRLMELLALRIGSSRDAGTTDEAFMVGVLSLMPTLLGLPIEDILAPLPLSPRVKQALTAGETLLGHLLDLVVALEGDDLAAVEAAVATLPGLTPAGVNASLSQALAWANSISLESVQA